MQLYATTTSERASKGQGGNEFLYIVIKNDQEQDIAVIRVTPYKGLSGKPDFKVFYDIRRMNQPTLIPQFLESKDNCDECIALNKALSNLNGQGNCGKHKGKRQKDDMLICKRCGLEHIKGTREATRDFVYSDICIACYKKEQQ